MEGGAGFTFRQVEREMPVEVQVEMRVGVQDKVLAGNLNLRIINIWRVFKS